jgi:hypothetical protein
MLYLFIYFSKLMTTLKHWRCGGICNSVRLIPVLIKDTKAHCLAHLQAFGEIVCVTDFIEDFRGKQVVRYHPGPQFEAHRIPTRISLLERNVRQLL